MGKTKYYVVWEGFAPGVYDSWDECRLQTEGYKGAKFKAFDSKEDAVEAFRGDAADHMALLQQISKHSQGRAASPKRPRRAAANTAAPAPTYGLAVDAACSGNPGTMEYRGVDIASGREIFRLPPMQQGTNNIGEFLALVHALALLKQHGSNLPVYSDSRNAILWVRQQKCKTQLTRTAANSAIFDLIARAENWLQHHTYGNAIIKWDTRAWGEIPADFGRK